MKSKVRIQITGLTSRNRPAATFTNVYEINPKLSPVAILNVSGVASRVTNAGIASVKSDQTTRPIDSVISAPTTIKAGAVAYPGIAVASGVKKTAKRNSPATKTLLNPVRAPAATPAALSM